jgi:prevent-host-death family protein
VVALSSENNYILSMEEQVSAAEANRKFSQLLRKVREGHSVVVTSHGKPIAKLIPIEPDLEARRRAKTELLARLDAQAVQDIGSWTREELYDD